MIERDVLTEHLTQRVADTATEPAEQAFEIGLRPQTMADFIGQASLKENLHVLIEAANFVEHRTPQDAPFFAGGN